MCYVRLQVHYTYASREALICMHSNFIFLSLCFNFCLVYLLCFFEEKMGLTREKTIDEFSIVLSSQYHPECVQEIIWPDKPTLTNCYKEHMYTNCDSYLVL